MEKMNQPQQEEPNFENEVDELAISMAELAKCKTELFLEKTNVNVQFQFIPIKSMVEVDPKEEMEYYETTILKNDGELGEIK